MAEALRDMWKVAPLPNPRLTRWAARAPGMRTRAHFSPEALVPKRVGGPECVGDLRESVSAAATFGKCARSAVAGLATGTDF